MYDTILRQTISEVIWEEFFEFEITWDPSVITRTCYTINWEVPSEDLLDEIFNAFIAKVWEDYNPEITDQTIEFLQNDLKNLVFEFKWKELKFEQKSFEQLTLQNLQLPDWIPRYLILNKEKPVIISTSQAETTQFIFDVNTMMLWIYNKYWMVAQQIESNENQD